jgi:hypothetical protein
MTYSADFRNSRPVVAARGNVGLGHDTSTVKKNLYVLIISFMDSTLESLRFGSMTSIKT